MSEPTGRVKRRAAIAAADFALAVNSKSQGNPLELVNCVQIRDEDLPFRVVVKVDALVLIDVHAHLLKNEIIGFLGGDYCPITKTLFVSTAEPCQSINNDHYQCEMDPVNQTSAYERLTKQDYKIVGWYHSHPTFAPKPSNRDIENQFNWQTNFGDQPFVGFIVAPYVKPNQKAVSNLSMENGFRLPTDTVALPKNPRRFYANDKMFDCDINRGPLGHDFNRLLSSDRKCFWVKQGKKNKLVPYQVNWDLTREIGLIPNISSKLLTLCEWIAKEDKNATMHSLAACFMRFGKKEVNYLDKILASLMSMVMDSVCSLDECIRILQEAHAILRDEMEELSHERSTLQPY